MVEMATLTGSVVDSDGEPIAGATASLGEAEATTNADGVFTLEIPAGARSVVRVDAAGYAHGVRPVEPGGADAASVNFTLFPATTTRVDLAMGEANVAVMGADGSVGMLTIPEGSVVERESGMPVDGPVDVTIAHVTPDDAEAGKTPLPMETADGPMVSYGMTEVTITTADGTDCNVAEDETLTLATAAEMEDPAEVPLWYWDEARGIWVQEGDASREGDMWVADLPHLTWWNNDRVTPFPTGDALCCRTIQIQTPRGVAIPGADMQYYPQSGGYILRTADRRGDICVAAECDSSPGAGVVIHKGGKRLVTSAQPEELAVDGIGRGDACGGPDACVQQVITVQCDDDIEDLRCPDGEVCGDDGRCGLASVCGDGVIEGGEACDDRNTDNGDGCSSTCRIEPGWACANAFNLNTGSDGNGGQLPLGAEDRLWDWTAGTLVDGDAPPVQPAELAMARWQTATVIRKCVGSWADAPANAQWINSTGWNAETMRCIDHPAPLEESLRYYRAHFNIAEGASAATTLSGELWADNQIRRIWINGHPVTEFVPPAAGGSSFHAGEQVPFNNWPSRYFQDGQNTIIIAVKNLASPQPPNPEGLIVSVPNAFSTASTCRALPVVCGDGVRVGDEGCDDGNTDPGDGCSAGCTVEMGWTCEGERSDCFQCRADADCNDAMACTVDQCNGGVCANEPCGQASVHWNVLGAFGNRAATQANPLNFTIPVPGREAIAVDFWRSAGNIAPYSPPRSADRSFTWARAADDAIEFTWSGVFPYIDILNPVSGTAHFNFGGTAAAQAGDADGHWQYVIGLGGTAGLGNGGNANPDATQLRITFEDPAGAAMPLEHIGDVADMFAAGHMVVPARDPAMGPTRSILGSNLNDRTADGLSFFLLPRGATGIRLSLDGPTNDQHGYVVGIVNIPETSCADLGAVCE